MSVQLTSQALKVHARSCGFDLVGIARAERHPKLARLADWIASGRAGEMTYLSDTLDERLDPLLALPTARSVVSLGVIYNAADPDDSLRSGAETPPEGAARAVIARYAQGDDYHDVLRPRLRALLRWMADTAGPGLEALTCLDTEPVQERVFAEQAGLGWIGKNTCLINPAVGSWIFLAEIITSADLEPDAPGLDQCGTCTRCLDACPTGALDAPYSLDARRCLSYLTIEVRGGVDETWRGALDGRVYGCDICQDVCPWNRRAHVSGDPAWAPRPALAAPHLIELCRLSDEGWRALLRDSAMRRAGLTRIRRSLAYAASGLDPHAREQALSALGAHESSAAPVVRDAMDWARKSRHQAPGTRL